MPRPLSLLSALLAVPLGMACAGDERDVCAPDDADGVHGGDLDYTFEVTVTDEGFTPTSIFTVQNFADVTVNLTNESSVERGFVVECLPTPNDDGCAQESCVDGAAIAPVAPGASASVTFTVPAVEGIYEVTTGVPGDTISGQLILQ